MNGVVRNVAIIAMLTVVPLGLGALIVGPTPPAGRTTHSVSRVGHKAFHMLAQRVGFTVRRFARGVEQPPTDRAVFVALEPGPFLFREDGRYAKSLLDWVGEGNGALITLGPDPDRDAELDDRDDLVGRVTKRAQAQVEAVEKRAREASGRADGGGKAGSGRRPIETSARRGAREVSSAWSVSNLAGFIGQPLTRDRLDHPATEPCTLTGTLAASLGSEGLTLTRPRVWADHRMTPVLLACGQPLILEYRHGNGTILLLSEPRLLHNAKVGEIAHARIGVRALEHLASRVDSRVVYFEEFSHGGREASSVFELAWTTAARWPVAQFLLVALIWVFAVSGRRRSVVPVERPGGRSKSEVIEAMATLYARTGDFAGVGARINELTLHRLGGTGSEIEASRIANERDLLIVAKQARARRLRRIPGEATGSDTSPNRDKGQRRR